MSRRRDPEATKQRLLWAAFREFHQFGFQKADMDRILSQAGVTKGALYHHFESKRGLGYAVVTEILRDWILDRWLRPVEGSVNPLDALVELARWGERTATPDGLALGCPLQSLSQELAGADEGFRQRLQAIYDEWHGGLASKLLEAQELGLMRSDVDARAAAIFVIAAWEGSIGLAKSNQSVETLSSCREGLELYLNLLKMEVG